MLENFNLKKFYKIIVIFFIGGCFILNGVFNITLSAFNYGRVTDGDAIKRARELGYVQMSEVYDKIKDEESQKQKK